MRARWASGQAPRHQAVWGRATDLPFLSLSFSICYVDMLSIPTPQGCPDDPRQQCLCQLYLCLRRACLRDRACDLLGPKGLLCAGFPESRFEGCLAFSQWLPTQAYSASGTELGLHTFKASTLFQRPARKQAQ